MEESKRQLQVARLVQEELGDIFLREGLNMIEGGMVSISKVSLTPDLMEARVYLSVFQTPNAQLVVKHIIEQTKEIRRLLGMRVKNQLRRIPELSFYLDDTLDHVFKMEELFKKIEEQRDDNKTTE